MRPRAPGQLEAIRIRGRSPSEPGDYVNIAIATADNLIGPTRIAKAEFKVTAFRFAHSG